MRLLDEVLEISLGAVTGIDRFVVLHVVAVVTLGRLHRREPERGHAERVEVVQALRKAVKVAPAVAVGVLETKHVHLIGQARMLVGRRDGCVVHAAHLIIRPAIVFVSPCRAGCEHVCDLVLDAQIYVVGARGRDRHIAGPRRERDLAVYGHRRGAAFAELSAAEVVVPGAILTELKLLTGGYAHLKCDLPITFGVHGEVVVPGGLAQRAYDGPTAGAELHLFRFDALAAHAGVSRVLHLSNGSAVPGEVERVHYGQAAPQGLLLVRGRVLHSAIVVQDEVDISHAVEAGRLPICPCVLADLLGAGGVCARPAAVRLKLALPDIGIHIRLCPCRIVQHVDTDVLARFARRDCVAVGERRSSRLHIEEAVGRVHIEIVRSRRELDIASVFGKGVPDIGCRLTRTGAKVSVPGMVHAELQFLSGRHAHIECRHPAVVRLAQHRDVVTPRERHYRAGHAPGGAFREVFPRDDHRRIVLNGVRAGAGGRCFLAGRRLNDVGCRYILRAPFDIEIYRRCSIRVLDIGRHGHGDRLVPLSLGRLNADPCDSDVALPGGVTDNVYGGGVAVSRNFQCIRMHSDPQIIGGFLPIA